MNRPPKQFVAPVRSSAARHRAATTLIEMVVVISLSSAVMATIGVMIDGVWKAQNSLGNQRVGLDNIARLADQFRADVHAAEKVELVALAAAPQADETTTKDGERPASILSVILPSERRVEYRFDQSAITRVVRTGDQVTQRESYALPNKCIADWTIAPLDVAPEAGGKQASLLISYPLEKNKPEYSERREFRIDAVVGLHRPEIRLMGRGS